MRNIWKDGPSRILPLAVAAATAIAFLPSLRNGFINLDDDWNFTFNQHYRGLSWPQLRWMFTGSIALGNYNPLHWLVLGTVYQFWGMNPLGYHLMGLGLHVLAAVLFYFIALRIFSLGDDVSQPEWAVAACAAAAALLFSLHPLRAEAVCWVSAEHYPLSTVCFMASVIFYLRYGSTNAAASRRRWYWFSVAAFACSQLALPIGETLPLLLLLLDVYPLKRLNPDPRRWRDSEARKILWEKAPFLLLTLLGLATAFSRFFVTRGVHGYPLSACFVMPWHGASFGLIKTLIPFDLRVNYQPANGVDLSDPAIWVPAVAAVALTALAALYHRRQPAIAAAWAFYFIALLPVSGLIPSRPGAYILGDRYSYLPGLSIALLAGAGLLRLARRRYFALALSCATILLIGLGTASWRQSRTWHDADTLFDDAIAKGQDDAWVHLGKGYALITDGKPDQALTHLEKTARLESNMMQPFYALGYAEDKLGRPQEALHYFDMALARDPNSAVVYNAVGSILASTGKMREAAVCFQRAVLLDPDHAGAHLNLGLVLEESGKLEEAAAQFRAALAINPSLTEARRNLDLTLSHR